MRLDTNQHMRMSQQMKLAPRMIQSMEILQMPMLALQERIEQELESNVALEHVEPGVDVEDRDPAASEAEGSVDEREMVVGADGSSDDFERLSDLESNYPQAFESDYATPSYSQSRMAGERDRKMDAMANIAARQDSLTDQLLAQWRFAEVEPCIAKVGERVIGYIDRDGLLGADLETILDQNRSVDGVEVTIELLERTLREIHFWIEPTGIGARDMRECLLLQIDVLALRADDIDWEPVRDIIEHHFDDLLHNRLPRIAQRMRIPMEQVQRAMEHMRLLRLRPGLDLVDEDVAPIIPDIIVEFDEDADVYTARLSDSMIPALRVSDRYSKMAKDRTVDKSARDFVGNSVRNATWLIESIGQRKHTLLRVVNVVLNRQRDFFDKGRQYLKPLPMVDVADQLGIHVGTVSRAVSDKWMHTPRGVVPLRMFFSGGTATGAGRDMSWEAVRATLQEIVDNEDKSRPLSDEALSAALKDKGIEIARRTVVKYRQQLDIPPARRRRVWTED